MRKIIISVLLLFALLLNSCCDKEENNLNTSTTINCAALEDGLIFGNEEAVEMEINELCQNYPPVPTTDDEIGHQENLDSIIFELNNQCHGFATELGCYACLESLPLQSIINFTLDSAGVEVKRTIRLRTPENEFMTYR